MAAPSAWPVFAGIDFERGRLFETTDLDEARLRCAQVFSPHELNVLGRERPLRARMDHLPVGPLSLNRLTWQAPVAVDPQRLSGYYLLSVPLRGQMRVHHGGQWHEVPAGQPVIVGGGERFHFTASADCEQIIVRLECAAVDAAWQALSGEAVRTPIVFDALLGLQAPAWRALEPTLGLMAGAVRGAPEAVPLPHLHTRLEDLLVTSLLLHQPHSALRPVPRRQTPPRPPALRRAEAYLEAHLHEAVTLATLAQAAGAPARTLQWAFQAAHGMGPMQWLRQLRLHAVRRTLLSHGKGVVSIADTAFGLGFTHLGEFSRAYRRLFGETPRETLGRRG